MADIFLDLSVKCWFGICTDLNLFITVLADGLAPTGARPSAGTVLTTKLFLQVPLVMNDYE